MQPHPLTNFEIQKYYENKPRFNYCTTFNYIDKILIFIIAKSSGVCIISSVSIVGAPVGIASASFTLIFTLATGIIKKLP